MAGNDFPFYSVQYKPATVKKTPIPWKLKHSSTHPDSRSPPLMTKESDFLLKQVRPTGINKYWKLGGHG